MAECALRVVLDRFVSHKRTRNCKWMSGRTGVYLDYVLGTKLGADLGTHTFVALSVRHATQKALLNALRSAGLLRMAGPEWLVSQLDGRERYEALRDAGIFETAKVEQLQEWLGHRPLELWYALRARRYAGVSLAVMTTLPLNCMHDYLAGANANTLDIEALTSLSPGDFMAVLVEHPIVASMFDIDWVVATYVGTHEDSVFHLVESHPSLGQMSPQWLADTFKSHSHLLGCLVAGEHLAACTPEWLAERFADSPNCLFSALQSGRHCRSVSATWLRDKLVEGSYLRWALEEGGHLGHCSPDWLADNLDDDHLYEALQGGGHFKSGQLSASWLADHLPVNELAQAIFECGVARDCTPDWIAANIPATDVFHLMAVGGHMKHVSAEWITENLAPEHHYRALHVYGHLEAGMESAEASWIYEHLEGKSRYKALRNRELLLGDEDIDVLHDVCGDELFAALHWEGRTRTEPLCTLKEHLTGDEMFEILVSHQPKDRSAEEYALYLSGFCLADMLRLKELVDTVPLDWLVAHLSGGDLAHAINGSLHATRDDIDALGELFSGHVLLSVLRQNELLIDLDHEWLARYLDPKCLAYALAQTRDIVNVEPEWIFEHVPKEYVGDLVVHTAAYLDLDPDLLAKYNMLPL